MGTLSAIQDHHLVARAKALDGWERQLLLKFKTPLTGTERLRHFFALWDATPGSLPAFPANLTSEVVACGVMVLRGSQVIEAIRRFVAGQEP